MFLPLTKFSNRGVRCRLVNNFRSFKASEDRIGSQLISVLVGGTLSQDRRLIFRYRRHERRDDQGATKGFRNAAKLHPVTCRANGVTSRVLSYVKGLRFVTSRRVNGTTANSHNNRRAATGNKRTSRTLLSVSSRRVTWRRNASWLFFQAFSIFNGEGSKGYHYGPLISAAKIARRQSRNTVRTNVANDDHRYRRVNVNEISRVFASMCAKGNLTSHVSRVSLR